MSTDSPLRVFVSSTYRDLIKDRETARAVIEQLASDRPIKWVGMEDFGALPTSPLIASQDFTEAADLVVLIVGRSYGSKPPDGDLSFTHEELQVVRRDKIPCLAYMRELDDTALDDDTVSFRRVVMEEMTAYPYATLDQLRARLTRDLDREVAALQPHDVLLPTATAPPSLDAGAFVGRRQELEQLDTVFAEESIRVGVWGSSGTGKTTLVQHFLSIGNERLDDPVWLRTDDLFGRTPDGRRRLGEACWSRVALLAHLNEIVAARLRAVLVFDNVQAAPLDVRWLASRVKAPRMIFISWDIEALPPVLNVVRVGPVLPEEAVSLLKYYVSTDQFEDDSELETLATRLGCEPLLLSLAGRRLRLKSGLTVSEVLNEMADSSKRLGLKGPTIDREDLLVRSTLLGSYHVLDSHERRVLTSLSRAPAIGLSQAFLDWAATTFGPIDDPRLTRASDLGLLEARTRPDWRGNRYRLRSIVRDFLETTDAYPSTEDAFEQRLQSEETLFDPSEDFVAYALEEQIRRCEPHLPHAGRWVVPLLVDARADIRARIGAVVRMIRSADQRSSLLTELSWIFRKPQPVRASIEIAALLPDLGGEASRPFLERLWYRPRTREDYRERVVWHHQVAYEAAKSLAKLAGQSLEQFLQVQLTSDDDAAFEAAARAASHVRIEQVLPTIVSLLDHPDEQRRVKAAQMLDAYEPQPDAAETLWRLAETAFDRPDGQAARDTLGLWRDERVLPALFAELEGHDDENAASAIAVLWRYGKRHVVDHVVAVGLSATSWHVIENAALVATDFGHPKAGDLVIRLLDHRDPRSCLVGALFAANVADAESVPAAQRGVICDRLDHLLAQDDRTLRMAARAALVAFQSPVSGEGLLKDLEFQDGASEEEESARMSLIMKLGDWTPPGFDLGRLERLLNDPNQQVRITAVLAAGKLRAVQLIDALKGLIADDSAPIPGMQSISHYASEALDRIAGRRKPLERGHQPVYYFEDEVDPAGDS